MSNIDYWALDGRSLTVFLTVFEEGSVTGAARRLGVSQSSVSHTLDKLRGVLRDPLFVRAGRGIMPTEHARSLRAPVQSAVDGMRGLTNDRVFDPFAEQMEFRIAANDFQRELLFPPLLRDFRLKGIDARFRFVPSFVPDAALLRDGRCHLIITPFPPDSADTMQTTLFRDKMVCFFDSSERAAPKTYDEFISSDHIEVRFPNHTSALSALRSVDVSEMKKPRVTVPSFGAVGSFMLGTRLITTQLSAMRHTSLKGFGVAELPFETPELQLAMAWHRRDHSDPAHVWLRDKVRQAASVLNPL